MGGENGWYFANFLWTVRGAIDRALGGAAEADHGSHGALRKHIGDRGIEVGGPRLVRGAGQTDEQSDYTKQLQQQQAKNAPVPVPVPPPSAPAATVAETRPRPTDDHTNEPSAAQLDMQRRETRTETVAQQIPALSTMTSTSAMRLGRIRTKTKIDAKYIAVGSALLQEPHEVARELHEKRAGLDSLRKRRFGIEQNNEIDIAGIIQLAAAELSHAEHDEAGPLAGNIRLG